MRWCTLTRSWLSFACFLLGWYLQKSDGKITGFMLEANEDNWQQTLKKHKTNNIKRHNIKTIFVTNLHSFEPFVTPTKPLYLKDYNLSVSSLVNLFPSLILSIVLWFLSGITFLCPHHIFCHCVICSIAITIFGAENLLALFKNSNASWKTGVKFGLT